MLVNTSLIPSKGLLFPTLFLLFFLNSCRQPDNFFEVLPSSETGIDFENKLEDKHRFNILYYLYFYNGGGVATGDINNDGLTDIYFTANSKGNNRLYLNKGNFRFEDVTMQAGVEGSSDWCTGVTMADVNGDGFLDIYVSSVSNRYGLKGHNELFINKGRSLSAATRKSGQISFTESAADYGLDVSCFTTQSAFFDYDHDGDLDCYVLNQSHHPHANIVDTVNRKGYDSLSGDRLYRNDMNTLAKKFTDVSARAGIYQSNLGYGLGLAVADLNNDGWDDIYVGNDFHENDYYYVNNGASTSAAGAKEVTFTESGAKHFNHYSRFSMGNDVADYNNDGQLDIVTVDMLPPDETTLKTYGSDENPDTYKLKLTRNGYQDQYSKNCLQRNNGNGSSFSETALLSGMSATDWSWSPLFADFDNDGNKDLFISSGIVKRPVDLDYIRFVSDLKMKGMDKTDKYDQPAIEAMPDGSSHPYLFKGDGNLKFTDVSDAWGTGRLKGYFNGASYADLDNDGKQDIIINCINAPAVILRNNGPLSNFLSVSFKGDGLNTFGIGAKAWVFAKGNFQYQQLMLTRGFQSSSDTRLHFGLDTLKSVDSLLIVWPDQKYQTIKDIAVNRPLIIDKKNASGTFDQAGFFITRSSLFTNITSKININWKHKENSFYDYNRQYLIPHALSTRGPKIAVADVNNDGLDDLYMCGAKGQPGQVMMQLKDGGFTAMDTAVFNAYAICEDVDAVFFDANKDSFPDLLVVSGGNELPVNNLSFYDRLYLNDGTGHFKIARDALPFSNENKSCLAISDVDNDGDNDVFIGTLTAAAYGLPQTSYLYINDGNAHFTVAEKGIIQLTSLGMVTSAVFTDLNNDGWNDLVVAGEWMPVIVYTNRQGKFVRADLPQSNGLWQTLHAADINGDGFTDILAGNWGYNSKLYAGKNGPSKLYVKDFDHNGSIEQIMACTIDGKEYPFLAKDELERPLPVLKKAYLKYSEVAGKTVQYIMFDLFKDYTELKADELGSCVFVNDREGHLVKKNLPAALQLAPVSAFQKVSGIKNGETLYIAGGNFFDVVPYEGKYDAQPLALLRTSKAGTGEYIPQPDLMAIKGQVRDIQWLNTVKFGKVLLVARNNEPLLFYTFNDQNQ